MQQSAVALSLNGGGSPPLNLAPSWCHLATLSCHKWHGWASSLIPTMIDFNSLIVIEWWWPPSFKFSPIMSFWQLYHVTDGFHGWASTLIPTISNNDINFQLILIDCWGKSNSTTIRTNKCLSLLIIKAVRSFKVKRLLAAVHCLECFMVFRGVAGWLSWAGTSISRKVFHDMNLLPDINHLYTIYIRNDELMLEPLAGLNLAMDWTQAVVHSKGL